MEAPKKFNQLLGVQGDALEAASPQSQSNKFHSLPKLGFASLESFFGQGSSGPLKHLFRRSNALGFADSISDNHKKVFGHDSFCLNQFTDKFPIAGSLNFKKFIFLVLL